MRDIPVHCEATPESGTLGCTENLPSPQRNLYRRPLPALSGMLPTHSTMPLIAVFVGLLLLRRWYCGLTVFALFVVLISIAATIGRQRTERATTLVGLSLYGTAAWLLLLLANDFDVQSIGDFISGALLLFLSFSMWASSLFLTQTAGWMSRSVASSTLAAAVVSVGSTVSSWHGL